MDVLQVVLTLLFILAFFIFVGGYVQALKAALRETRQLLKRAQQEANDWSKVARDRQSEIAQLSVYKNLHNRKMADELPEVTTND